MLINLLPFSSPSASLTAFLIEEHTTAPQQPATITSAAIPSLPNITELPSQNTPLPPFTPSQNCSSSPTKPSSSSAAGNASTSANVSTTSNDEGEASDSNTHSPAKSSSKERDDLKERLKAEKKAAKKLAKEMAICKIILEEMEVINQVPVIDLMTT